MTSVAFIARKKVLTTTITFSRCKVRIILVNLEPIRSVFSIILDNLVLIRFVFPFLHVRIYIRKKICYLLFHI
jgi:hypothetical protein